MRTPSAARTSSEQMFAPPTITASSAPPLPDNRSANWQMPAQALEELESRRHQHRSHHICPHCGSTDTERRRRKLWEKVVFNFTTIRAYKCRICGADFYARRKVKGSSQDS